MPSIGDALGIDYHGGLADVSRLRAANFSVGVVGGALELPEPATRQPAPDVSHMIGKQANPLGNNVDIWG